MEKTYSFTVEGTGGNGQTWKATGSLTCRFPDVFDRALAMAFEQLTSGRAVFGMPGVGCNGPYDMTKVVIEQVRQ